MKKSGIKCLQSLNQQNILLASLPKKNNLFAINSFQKL